jgi:hypothetical protein
MSGYALRYGRGRFCDRLAHQADLAAVEIGMDGISVLLQASGRKHAAHSVGAGPEVGARFAFTLPRPLIRYSVIGQAPQR